MSSDVGDARNAPEERVNIADHPQSQPILAELMAQMLNELARTERCLPSERPRQRV